MTQKMGLLSLFNQHFRLKLFIESIFIGICVGTLIVAFRIFLEKAEELRGQVYTNLKVEGIEGILLWFLGLIIISLILAYIVRKAPMSGGSGIPQVKGVLLGQLIVNNPVALVTGKFIGGLLGIGSGLSLGREGPSVQLGAALSDVICRKMKLSKIETKYLITCGASAGLAAAFNAPMAGVIFALEELHKNFSPTVLISAMAASLSADVVTQNFFGQNPIFNFQNLPAFPLKYFIYLFGLGIICGLFGVIFNRSLIKSLNFYDKLRVLNIPRLLYPTIALLTAGGLGFILPEVLGGGNKLVESINGMQYALPMVFIILLVKFIFTMLCYGSGVPGGIFLPLLVLGSLTGYIYGHSMIFLFQGNSAFVDNFMVYAMAACFTAIVKAPVTGSILITEMTGSFQHLLPLIFVSMTAYIVADILKSKPVYDILLERYLNKQKPSHTSKIPSGKSIHEFVVCMGSPLDGKSIKDISWPKGCLLVSVKRGDLDMIPSGNTFILPGDYLYALVEEENLQKYKIILKLTEDSNS